MELNEKDKELIAKIDERLKHYKLITDNEQADKEEYVECINNHGFEDHLIFENIYKVIGKDDEYYELIIKGLQSGFYVKKRFKPSTKEAYLKQFLPDNEQQAPAEITEQKELYYITIVGNSIHITTRFGLDLERAAQEIRKTLENI